MVVQRYRDEREIATDGKVRFNILWSNVAVLSPSLYGRPPKPDVSRRFKDADPVGRLASTILERCLEYEIEQFPAFNAAMSGAVQDRLLPGRGVAWLRSDTADLDKSRVDKEYSPVEYVYWKDFLHSPARIWEEVWWVAKRSYLTQEAGIERFGEAFKLVPLEYKDENSGKPKDKNKDSEPKEAKVWEIWNKRTNKVCWIADGYGELLDEKDDPLKLEGFFPCPKPLYATVTTDTLIPVPDYCEYQDQAKELDVLTERINKISRAVKAVGVYNKEFKEIGRMLAEGVDNQMFGVDNWMALAEKNGLKGNVELLDLTTQIQALGALYTAREQVKQTIYEICGISDILRGSTKAEETLGAQELKANFGSLRLRDSQREVARFAADIFKLKSQVIALYPPELLLAISGVQGTQDGQNPDLLQAAVALLKESTVRDFRIAVESDTLAQIDEQEEHAKAAEMLEAIGGLLDRALPALQAAPELLPMVSEILKSTMRSYHSGRQLEAATDQSFQLLAQRLIAAAQNPPPSEAEIEAQAQVQADQMRAQNDAAAAKQKAEFDLAVQAGKLQQEGQLAQQKAQMDERQTKLANQVKLAIESMNDETERFKAILQSETQLMIAQMGAQATLQSAQMGAQAQKETAAIGAEAQKETAQKKIEGDKAKQENNAVDKTLPSIADKMEQLIAIASQPRKRTLTRDAEGRIEILEDEPEKKIEVKEKAEANSLPDLDGKMAKLLEQANRKRRRKVIRDDKGEIQGYEEEVVN